MDTGLTNTVNTASSGAAAPVNADPVSPEALNTSAVSTVLAQQAEQEEGREIERPVPIERNVEQAEAFINEQLLAKANQSIQFSEDDLTGRTIIHIVDKTSGEQIRQIPTQDFLELVHNLNRVAESILSTLPRVI